MSARDLYGINSASTPIKKSSLPQIAVSTIEATSSQKIRNRAKENYGSSSSSEPRDSKERFLSASAKGVTIRRRYVSGTPNESKTKKRKIRREERTRIVRRRIEDSRCSDDEINWQTTVEKTLSPETEANDPLEKSIQVNSLENVEGSERVLKKFCSSNSEPNYPWEKMRESVREVSRIVDEVENILEDALPRTPYSLLEKEAIVRSKEHQCVDSDDDIVLIVNDHEKVYPVPLENKKCHMRKELVGKSYLRTEKYPLSHFRSDTGMENNDSKRVAAGKRHVRNRQLMMEIRNEDTERAKKLATRKGRRTGRHRAKQCISSKQSSSGEMITLREGNKPSSAYHFNLSFDESDEEVFVVNGMKFLKNPPRRKFTHVPESPEMKIDWNTGKYTLVPVGNQNGRAPNDQAAREKVGRVIDAENKPISGDRNSRNTRLLDERPIKSSALYLTNSRIPRIDESSNVDESEGNRSDEIFSRSRRRNVAGVSESRRKNVRVTVSRGVLRDRKLGERSTRSEVRESRETTTKISGVNSQAQIYTIDDLSEDDSVINAVKRKRPREFESSSRLSISRESLEKRPSDRRSFEDLGKTSFSGKLTMNKVSPSIPGPSTVWKSSEMKSLERISPKVGRVQKKHRRILHLLYSDESSSSPEVSPKMVEKSRREDHPVDKPRNNFTLNEAKTLEPPRENINVDSDDRTMMMENNETPTKRLLDTIVKGSLSGKRRNKKFITTNRSSRRETSNSSKPKIVSDMKFVDGFYKKISPGVWRINKLTEDFDEL